MRDDPDGVAHSLHNGGLPWLDETRRADASASCFGLSFNLRKRRTSDGYTRLEGHVSAPVRRTEDGGVIFTIYLSDDERRAMANALLEGITETDTS